MNRQSKVTTDSYDGFRQILGGMDPQAFLRDYWQKKPLLIRNALPNFKTLVQPNELAGLALESEVESRLVTEKVTAKNKAQRWQLKTGPFTAKDFKALPKTHWTLLVQAVDHFLPQVAALRERFRFIPDWRIDDVMISYASDQGSVGPHVDNYDVFLLQGLGMRRWQVGGAPMAEEILIEGCPLRVLRSFKADQSFELHVGDILYVPPRFAHWGVSLGDGMTYSIGFRSPSCADLLATHMEQLLANLGEQDRLTDPWLKLQSHPAEIRPEAIKYVVDWLLSNQPNPNEVQHWFGKMVTSPKTGKEPGYEALSNKEARALFGRYVKQGSRTAKKPLYLMRSEDARIAFIDAKDGVLLFVNGEEFLLSKNAKNFVAVLAGAFRINPAGLAPFLPDYESLLVSLLQAGVFYITDELE